MGGVGRWALIVLGVAALVAVAIPNILEPKVSWADTSSIAALRNLASVQADFRKRALVDGDGDGIGEFGTFGEMTRTCGLRKDSTGTARGALLSVAVLSPVFTNVSADGIATRSLYCFRILLPAKGGGWSREGPPGAPMSAPVDSDGAEARWCAYAWPDRDYGELTGTGRNHIRTLFVDQSGDVWQTMNLDRRYKTPSGGPAWDAAMPAESKGAGWVSPSSSSAEFVGRDGNTRTRLP